MSDYHDPRRRRTNDLTINTQKSGPSPDIHVFAASPRAPTPQYVAKRRPSLASPLPPTPIVPSTALPGGSATYSHHHQQQPIIYHQQRPSTAPSTSSAFLSDPPSTRGMMKRLLAKPAPPSSPLPVAAGSAHISSMPLNLPEQHQKIEIQTNEDEHEKRHQDQNPIQEISAPAASDDLLAPQSPNEFEKSMHALDLVGQIDISMSPCTTVTTKTQDDHERQNTDQDPFQEIPPTTSDVLHSSHSPYDFDKSIRALDLVGQIDISMVPSTITEMNISQPLMEPNGSREQLQPTPQVDHPTSYPKKQRNVLRRRPSANNKGATTSRYISSSTPIPSSSEWGPTGVDQQMLKDGFRPMETVATSPPPTPMPSVTTPFTPLHPPPLRQPYHSQDKPSSPSARRPLPKIPLLHTTDTNDFDSDLSHNKVPNVAINAPTPKPNGDVTLPPPTNSPSPKLLQHNANEESATVPYYTVFGDISGRVVAAGGPGDVFWDSHAGGSGEELSCRVSREKIGQGQSIDESTPGDTAAGGGLTKVLVRSVSGRRKKHDVDQHQQQIRSKPSTQELTRSSVDKEIDGRLKVRKLSDSIGSPGGEGDGSNGGDSPSRRFWKLMKKISVTGLREKHQIDSNQPPPPVPPLPNNLANNHIQQEQYRTLNNSRSSESSLTSPRRTGGGKGLKKAVTSISSAASPTTPIGKARKPTPLPSTPLPTSTQNNPKLPHSAPAPSLSGPRPSTTTRSSSPSSDLGSSRYFNRTQSPRSSTSSFGEELPPLPKASPSSITSKPNGKTTVVIGANSVCVANRKLQQHIIPPSELVRNHSTSNHPTASSTTTNTKNSSLNMAIPTHPPPLPMDDDWTIVRSPSVELEALSLPPPPRRPGGGSLGLGLGMKGIVGLERKGIANAGSQVKVLKMANMSSEKVGGREETCRDASGPSIKEDGKPAATEPEQEDTKEGDTLEGKQPSDHDSIRSQSPTIPSFSTSSAINSFPARRLSSSLSVTSKSKGSPTSSRSSGGGISSRVNGLATPSPQPRLSRNSQPEARSTFGRVRQHLFGTNGFRVKAEKDGEGDEGLNPLPSTRKSESRIRDPDALHQYAPQQQRQETPRRHYRHSSGNTGITKSRSVTATASSTTVPTPPAIAHPHRRSMSFNTSLSALPSAGTISSALSASPYSSSALPSPPSRTRTPSPSLSSNPAPVSQMASPPPAPPAPPAPPLIPKTSHRIRSSTNLHAGFSSKKLSDVFFPSPSSALPSLGSGSTSTRPSSASSHRTIGNLMNRSMSVGASKSTDTITSHPPLTDQEKADKWADLLARSARAGGTLHLAAGNRLLDSDDL